MSARRLVALFSCMMFSLFCLSAPLAEARGHDGVYMGMGYTQLFMYTPEQQSGGPTLGRVNVGPGFGGNAVVGYDFCGTRWGIQMPFEITTQRLNRAEWPFEINLGVEAVLHLVEWRNELDFHLVGGAGWNYLTEGGIQNHSRSQGISADLGPGLSYYFFRGEKSSAALTFEVPFRMVHYFGDHLSGNGTTFIAFPMRISVQVGF
ncbi:MAG: hypothetical protein V2A66_01010 [Pseudomonadota bacterium]